VAAVAIAAVAGACSGGAPGPDDSEVAGPIVRPDGSAAPAGSLPFGQSDEAAPVLVRFESCAGLVEYLRSNASTARDGGRVGEAIPPPAEPAAPSPEPPAAPSVDAVEAPTAAPPAEPSPEDASGAPVAEPPPVRSATPPDGFSVTNVQETGVDEPDLVKTDGTRMFVLAQGAVQALDVRGGEPRLVGTFPVSGIEAPQLLLAGDRLAVIGFGASLAHIPIEPGEPTETAGPRAVVRMLVLDVSDPARIRVAGAASAEGQLVSARLTGSTVRVVVSTQPGWLPESPAGDWLTEWAYGSEQPGDADGIYERWVPRIAIEDAEGDVVTSTPIVPCRAVSRPEAFSGHGLTSVVSLDLAGDLALVDRDAVLGDAQTVYASPTSIYVATQPWVGDVGLDGRAATSIHRFDTSAAGSAEYRSSGVVPGYLLNQWSLSEHDGLLRVATTGEPPWWDDTSGTESQVVVLAERGDRLQPIGAVGGLGRGERIFGVRFAGSVGYVVTFRQTDPLYTLDLSDPRHPRVVGELKIPGYSAYLHPLDDGLLLGVGQDATETGQVLGTQIALFDVSDLAHPERLHKRTLDGARSEVESDHHAFLWWAKRRLGVMPVEGPVPSVLASGDEWFRGAVGFEVDRERGIAPRGVLAHPGDAQIRRAVVIGDELLTISEAGVEASDIDTFAEDVWAGFALGS
jgi:hypothetical protein